MMASRPWKTEPYVIQQQAWPAEGCHILAQYDEDSVVVYQAFNHEIAKYAVENQRPKNFKVNLVVPETLITSQIGTRFGGPAFSYERMSWIKTNFLWMMYRCGWASKSNQQHVLAVRIKREDFEEILRNAYTPRLQKKEGLTNNDIQVRLQWDPDHEPNYDKCARRAIQLGLKGEILKKYGTEWIVSIEDITDFVKEQKKVLDEKGTEELLTASEVVYRVDDPNIVTRINLDEFPQ